MAFDGIITNCIINELNNNVLNCKIEKIYMPSKNEIDIVFHLAREKVRLLISIDPSNARFHLSKTQKDNPMKAPQFCMVLRKYLQGAKLNSINQLGLDRVAIFTFENLNELGDLENYKLYVELMGKYSNIILVNSSNRILDSIRHVDATMSSIREVLPGRDYIAPTTLNKQEFAGMNYEQFIANLELAAMDPYFSLESMNKIIANQFVGFSKTFIDNLFAQCGIKEKFNKENTTDLFNLINLILYNSSNHMVHFKMFGNDYHVDLNDFSTTINKIQLSEFLDDYYAKKEFNSILKNAKLNLQKVVNGFVSKYQKNLARVNEILDDSVNMDKYKLYGDLITTYIYKISPGDEEVTLENYNDNNSLVAIPLNSSISPSKNAQSYYKKYNKLKNAIAHASEQKEDYLSNIDYLNGVLYLIDSASSTEEINEIKKELSSQGYINYATGKKKYSDEKALEPYSYNFDGITILAGRNNIQNDNLTLKESKKTYTWLHVKDFHGSHVIIKDDNPSDACIEYAAKIAAAHSEAKESSKVSVDYTKVKFVHKPSGAKPGKVIYTDYKTIVI
ncbi:MAG: NFACT family protein [Clostridia bacterium]|nr:NFACT family protein [Clostridia bacterium]